MYKKRLGYVLPLTLMLIFLSMAMVMSIVYRGSSFVPYAHIAIERQKAYLLAQTGIQLAISQLVAPKVAQKKENISTEQKKKPSKEEQIKEALTVILPRLNRWQEFTFRESIEGIDATVNICIMCENGKIYLNAFCDFEKHTFLDEDNSKKIFKELFEKIGAYVSGKDLFGSFEKMIKARNYPFNDATELLNKEFSNFYKALFYEPSKSEKKIFLTDIFTVWTGKRSVNPWLMSQSVANLFGLQSDKAASVEERKKRVAEWLKPFKLNAKWQSDWDKVLKPLYGKEFNSISKSLQPLLSSTFEADVFSVLSQATVGKVTQRLLAIVEAPLAGQTDKITIKKVYWL